MKIINRANFADVTSGRGLHFKDLKSEAQLVLSLVRSQDGK